MGMHMHKHMHMHMHMHVARGAWRVARGTCTSTTWHMLILSLRTHQSMLSTRAGQAPFLALILRSHLVLNPAPRERGSLVIPPPSSDYCNLSSPLSRSTSTSSFAHA